MVSPTEFVDHTKKSTLDIHLKSDKHKNNITKAENLKLTRQTTLDTISTSLNEHEQINIALEKVDKLKNFFFEYCKNGSAIVSSDQL
ncbi:3267_t:CDS:2, partial [Scutellospora calospora]